MLNEQIIIDIKGLIEGDVSIRKEDIEHYARDTSLFYIKPQIVVFPKNKDDISKLIKYLHS